MGLNFDKTPSGKSEAIDLHYSEKGEPIISFRGHLIKAFSAITTVSSVDEINTATISCAINIRADDSRVRKIYGKSDSENHLVIDSDNEVISVDYKGERIGIFIEGYQPDDKDKCRMIAAMMQLNGIESDLSYDVAEEAIKLWKK